MKINEQQFLLKETQIFRYMQNVIFKVILWFLLIGMQKLESDTARTQWVAVWNDTLDFKNAYPIGQQSDIETVVKQLNFSDGKWLICVCSDVDSIIQSLQKYSLQGANCKNKLYFQSDFTDIIQFEFSDLDSLYKTPLQLLPDGHWIYLEKRRTGINIIWDIFIKNNNYLYVAKQYDSSGVPIQEINFGENGRKNGIMRTKDVKTKNTEKELVYRDGKIIEEIRYYYWMKNNYKMLYRSQNDLIQKSWHENSKLKSIIQLDSNMQFNGKAKGWYPNGKIEFEGEYKNGNKEGIWKYYNPNGRLRKKG